MKKGSLIPIAVLMVALLFVLISVVSARSDQSAVIECVIDIAFDEYPDGFYWQGPVTGCSLEGTIEFRENEERPYYETGNMAHFFEKFTIYPDSGGEIYGKNWGVWNFSTFKFRANGWVRETSPEWAHLVGAKYHEMGTTSPPPPEPGPIYAPGGTAKLVPANRQPHALP